MSATGICFWWKGGDAYDVEIVDYHRAKNQTPGNQSTMPRKTKKLPPIHPGEVLREEFLKPMGITQYRLAKDIDVPQTRISEIVLQVSLGRDRTRWRRP